MVKSFFKILIISTLFLIVSACATTSIIVPEKYMLDNQLDRVNEIPFARTGRGPANIQFNQAGEDPLTVMKRRDTITLSETDHQWIKVDKQSFIMRSSPSVYYLLVLDRPAVNLMSTTNISLAPLSNVLKAGVDFLELDNIKYIINRIYVINGRDKVHSIINQVKNSK